MKVLLALSIAICSLFAGTTQNQDTVVEELKDQYVYIHIDSLKKVFIRLGTRIEQLEAVVYEENSNQSNEVLTKVGENKVNEKAVEESSKSESNSIETKKPKDEVKITLDKEFDVLIKEINRRENVK